MRPCQFPLYPCWHVDKYGLIQVLYGQPYNCEFVNAKPLWHLGDTISWELSDALALAISLCSFHDLHWTLVQKSCYRGPSETGDFTVSYSLHSDKLWFCSSQPCAAKEASLMKCDSDIYLETTQTRLPIWPVHGQACPPHSFTGFWVSVCQWTWSSLIQLARLAGQQQSCLVHRSAGVTGAHVKASFYIGARDLSRGLNTCVASTIPPEPLLSLSSFLYKSTWGSL